MNDYKKTLNLPQTDFPMKGNLPQTEPTLLKKWEEIKLYQKLRAVGEDRKKFILHLGPPYANGHIHLGTATTSILKDMIVKSKTLSGYESPLVPGWDCHGLPIELNVEKKIGKPGQKVTAAEFRRACREYANSFINIQREEFKRLGIIADWDHPYLTMNPSYEADIIRSLGKIIQAGHLQKGYKPVHWCLDCASALAEAEVEYAEKTSPSIDVRFAIVNQQDFWQRFAEVEKQESNISIPIWTTTPWTLPSNQAVALNPSLNYVLVQTVHEQLLLAEDLLLPVMQRYGIENYRILGCIVGEQLENLKLKHPFYDKEIVVVLGEHVTIESGTGAVHTAPAHGLDDYAMGRKYQLPLESLINDDGCFSAATPLFTGMHVNKVNDKVIAELQSHGSLLHQTTIRHSYPHCWRHKTALIFRATPQWFISMEQNGLREKALRSIDRVEWIPDWGRARIYGMIENRPDWCISRQRAWGVPLSLFVNKVTGELHPDTLNLLEAVAKRVEQEGIEAWYTINAEELLGKDDAVHYQKISDVLDVWFDSGVSHECVLKKRPELKFPADIVLEGSDQHRGWFQSSLLTSVAINNEESYKEVLTHGFVVDGQGRKMSKSIGNVIAPEEVVQTSGADILRLWVASVDYRNEITASKEILTRTSETYRRIRNTARFLLANLHDFDPRQHMLAAENMLMLDRFIVDKTRILQAEIVSAYETYQFHQVVQKLHQFCINDLGGFYLDIIKDRQYTMATNSRGRRSAQTALFHVIHALVRWMAPILSFTAEEIWKYIPGKQDESVFLHEWYQQLAKLSVEGLMNQTYWEKIRAVRDAVNKEIEKERNAEKIGSALEAEVYLYCGTQLQKQLDALGDELRFVLITSFAKVIPMPSAPQDAILTDVPGLALKIEATTYQKCDRCWQRRSDVNTNPDYPGLCGRCVENVAGEGEVRNFA